MRLGKGFQFLFICPTLEELHRNLAKTQKQRLLIYISWFDLIWFVQMTRYSKNQLWPHLTVSGVRLFFKKKKLINMKTWHAFSFYFFSRTVLLHTGEPSSKLKCNSILLGVFYNFFVLLGWHKLCLPRFPALGSESLINTHNFVFLLLFSFSWSGNVSVNSFIKFISNQLPLWDQHCKPKKKWPYVYMYLFTRAIEITCLINHEI